MSDGARTDDGERDAPLWASSLDSRPRIPEEELGRVPTTRPREAASGHGAAPGRPPRGDAGPAAVTPATPPFPAPEPELSQSSRRRLALYGAALMVCLIVLGLYSERGLDGYLADLPSSWDDTRMTCKTTRFENDERVLEFFQCRAVDGGVLPLLQRQPIRSRWQSDVTQEFADAGEVTTAPPDRLDGWAVYFRP